ncbi:MAG TPA: hypothetical protein VFU04_07815 [Solirubrobacterales bacterium]|nr:hypothetical protein [Solirubrobacterales bacterium]
MEAMRQSWTDDRLDDLSGRMEQRFDKIEAEMDQRFGKVEAEMDQRFGKVESEVRDLRLQIIETDRHRQTEFNSLQRTMIQVGGGLLAANTGLMAAVIGLMITQL